MVWTWLEEHEDELDDNWTRARNRQVLQSIAPLD